MSNLRVVTVFAACVWALACHPAEQEPESQGRVLERHRIDLDGDRVPDDVTLWFADSLDPGIMNRVEMRLSRAGTRVVSDTVNRWDPAPDDFQATNNLVKSRLIYVADLPDAGRLLFLFGPATGCCLQSLTIFRLSADGPEEYFRASEFGFEQSPQVVDGKGMMAGGGRSEAALTPEGFTWAAYYEPLIAYRFGPRVLVDTAATLALNQRLRGGFGGFEPRTDMYVVQRPDGSQALWDPREHRVVH